MRTQCAIARQHVLRLQRRQQRNIADVVVAVATATDEAIKTYYGRLVRVRVDIIGMRVPDM